MRCRWRDRQGSSGEGNEVIAGQTGVADLEQKESLRASGGQVDNNSLEMWECGWREGEAGCDNYTQ